MGCLNQVDQGSNSRRALTGNIITNQLRNSLFFFQVCQFLQDRGVNDGFIRISELIRCTFFASIFFRFILPIIAVYFD